MRHVLHIILFCGIANAAFCQKSFIVKGIVKNQIDEAIEDALIMTEEPSTIITKTNKKGAFEFKTSNKENTYIIKHVGYKTDTISLNLSDVRSLDDLNFEIVLYPRELDIFVVSAKQKPTVVHGDDQSSVQDFIQINDQWLLLSYYTSLNKDPIIKLLSKDMKLLDTYEAPKEAIRFFKGYNKHTYLICDEKVFIITAVQNDIRLLPVDEENFYSQVYFVIDTLNNSYIYKLNKMEVPSFSFYHQSMEDTSKHIFHKSEDQFMMGLFRAEYKYARNEEKRWAYQQELNTGIDKELWIGKLKFTSSPYYKTPYAPLFVSNNEITLFDHCNDHIYTYTNRFEKLDSVKITYHTSKSDKNWKQPILMDKVQNQWYALFESGGRNYLKFIDISTGETQKAFKLYYRYTENIQIIDDYVYYIYRPYASAQRKYLYRELIN